MATIAKIREGELARLAALDQAEVLGERGASDLGRGRMPSPRLSVERLCKVIGKGHGGAPHNCIIASPGPEVHGRRSQHQLARREASEALALTSVGPIRKALQIRVLSHCR
jgi:hypothetical protein